MTKENKSNENGNEKLSGIESEINMERRPFDEEIDIDMGSTPLDKGDEILGVSEKQYWEDKINQWKSQASGIETMIETGIRDKKIVSPAKKITSRLKRHLRHMRSKLADHYGFNFHQLGSKLKKLEKLIKFARRKKLPKIILKSSFKKLSNSSSEVNFEQLFGQSEEILFELRKLESDIQEELEEKFGDYQNFGPEKELDDLKHLSHHGGDFHVGKKTGRQE